MVPHPTPTPEELIPSRPYNRRQREPQTRVNRHIRAPEVRLLGLDGEQVGVVPIRQAQKMASDIGYDLVEISANASPPVCRIMDHGKFKYDQEKKKKEAKKHQSVVKVKEVKYHANTENHDYQTKLRRARHFLEEGNRVKCSLWFRGRENSHHDLGYKLFERVIEDVKDLAQVDSSPRLAGRSLSMLISPIKK